MNNDIKFKDRNDSILRIMNFCLAAIDRQLKTVQDRIDFIYNNTNARGIQMPEDIGTEYETKRKQIEKLQWERNHIMTLINQINYLSSLPYPTNEARFNDISNLVNPFFNEKTNVYAGVQGTGNVFFQGGSQFKQIMKDAELYGKLSREVNELENSARLLTVRRTMNNSKPSQYEKDSLYRIRDKKTEIKRIESRQKIIMLKRKQVIDRKNKFISRIEGKAEEKYHLGNTTGYNFYMNAARNLRNFPIVMLAPAPVLLLKEEIVSHFTKYKNLKYGKYDKHGNRDYRPWETRRAEELEEKINKKL